MGYKFSTNNCLLLLIVFSLLVYSSSLRKYLRYDNNEVFILAEKDESISAVCKDLNIESDGNFIAKCFGKEIKEDLNKCISVNNKGKLIFLNLGDFSKKCENCKIQEYYKGEKLICDCLNYLDEKIYTELHLSDNLKHKMKGNEINCEA
jgi:hypothetical protein